MERSVRRNETRDAAAWDRAVLTELNSIDLGYAKRAGGQEPEQVMSPMIPDMLNDQEDNDGNAFNGTPQDELPFRVDDNLICTPSTPGEATMYLGNWEMRIDHLEEMLQSVLVTVVDAREQSRGRSERR
jgi:hypothetical protein